MMNMSDKDIKEGQKSQEKASKAEKQEKKKGEDLQKKVEELQAKIGKEHDDYLRLMAEFETFRRRSAEERLAIVGSASADTIVAIASGTAFQAENTNVFVTGPTPS